MSSELRQATWDSPIGRLRLLASPGGLVRLDFMAVSAAPPEDPVLIQTITQLEAYFTGKSMHFDIPFDLRGTPFQLAVWNAVCEIPWGSTTTYHEIAARIGRPTAIRAVGAANGANPISIIVPCHRLIGADGSLRGYGGGIEQKKFLLALEKRTIA